MITKNVIFLDQRITRIFTAGQVLGSVEQLTHFVTQIVRLVHAARGIRNGLIPGFDQFLEAVNVFGRLDLLD